VAQRHGPIMISHLLEPILGLHGWEAYGLVGLFVFAEASVLFGFIFPGEIAVILGGVLANRGHVNIVELIVVVVLCAIAGDSIGYLVGQQFGRRLLDARLLRTRRSLLERILEQLNRRGAIAVFMSRFTAFLRAVTPGLAGMSDMPYRTFFPANVAGGIVWGTAYCLLGYFVGNAYRRVESVSGVASDVLLGLVAVLVVVLVVRGRRRERAQLAEAAAPADPDDPG
jgi:membrane protein DedA with SNARE-associated domain